jgi:dTDP-4-dehydrorhamnose 3,5-epimerase
VKILPTDIEGVWIIEPDVFEDPRGYFLEIYRKEKYDDHGIVTDFVQDNLSFSVKNTLRGLHYQYPNGQAKLVQVLHGEVFDVAVDIRCGSPTFGRWTGAVLSASNKRQLYVPEGFAHGFCVMSDSTTFLYKCSDYYAPRSEGGIIWSDPGLAIDWPVVEPLMSEKDQEYSRLKDIARDKLPAYEE